MLKNRTLALIFRLTLAAAIVVGLLMNFGLLQGQFYPGALMFYTIQSNILILVLLVLLLARTIRDLRRHQVKGNAGYYPRFQFVCVINILLTGAVYWLILAPSGATMTAGASLWAFFNTSVHLIAPLGCLLDYILFTRRGQVKYSDNFRVLIFPALYLIFASTAGLLGYTYGTNANDGQPVHYPYPFMDYDRAGAGAAITIVGLLVALLIASHILYLFYRRRRLTRH